MRLLLPISDSLIMSLNHSFLNFQVAEFTKSLLTIKCFYSIIILSILSMLFVCCPFIPWDNYIIIHFLHIVKALYTICVLLYDCTNINRL